jgi:hypothetical protein
MMKRERELRNEGQRKLEGGRKVERMGKIGSDVGLKTPRYFA